MSIFKPRKTFKFFKGKEKKKDLPSNLLTKCESCFKLILNKQLEANLWVCPNCGYHFSLPAYRRIGLTVDEGSFQELFLDITTADPLNFSGPKTYQEKLEEARKRTGMDEAIIAGLARLAGRQIAIAVTDSRFIMGSMGSVLGEKIARLAELAKEKRLPLITISASGGGARMYEGMFSLMQMAKTSAAIGAYQRAGGVFISVLTNPTMAGVLASFASLGDVLIAEPGALIGFAGPRVIKKTINQDLPEGFQRSEFLQEHGLIDMIVERKNLRKVLIDLVNMLCSNF